MEERASGRVGINLFVFSKFLSYFGLNIYYTTSKT